MIKIYGNPYHSLEYYFLNENDIYNIIFKNNEDLKDITKIDYIDGIFSIVFENEKFIYIISDPYGLYPIFYNENEMLFTDNFDYYKNKIEFEKNNDYIDLATKNYDISYHSNLNINNSLNMVKQILKETCLITPFKNWKITKPGTITILNKTEKTKKTILYNIFNITLDLIEPEQIIEKCILELSKNKKVLLPLSAGYDSRTILSVLLNNRNFDRYTYGKEKEYVDTIFDKIGLKNVLPNNFSDYNNIDQYVTKYCLEMNGLGDLYYKVHNMVIQDIFYNYDVLFTGDGSNEFIGNNKDNFYLFYSFRYTTGDGHHYKTQSRKIKSVSPYCQKRLFSVLKNTKKSDSLRRKICENIIRKNNKQLLDFDIYSGDSYTQNKYSNFGFIFDYNTKLKYLNIFYEVFFS